MADTKGDLARKINKTKEAISIDDGRLIAEQLTDEERRAIYKNLADLHEKLAPLLREYSELSEPI